MNFRIFSSCDQQQHIVHYRNFAWVLMSVLLIPASGFGQQTFQIHDEVALPSGHLLKNAVHLRIVPGESPLSETTGETHVPLTAPPSESNGESLQEPPQLRPTEMPEPPAPQNASSTFTTPALPALILYDAPTPDSYGKMSLVYAEMLESLLGHFQMRADLVPVENYTAGKLSSYGTIFYLGSYYDQHLPDSFLKDVAHTDKRVVWFRYNIWQLAWSRQLDFTKHTGLKFIDLRGFDQTPSAAHPDPGFFDTVLYKGMSMKKYYHYDPKTNRVDADPDVGEMSIVTNPAPGSPTPKIWVKIRDSHTGKEIPYITQSGNFWYVSDIPLSYIGPRDRYLVFCDMLHDILAIQHPENHRALVRFEDVDAMVTFESMQRLSEYLARKHIPFSVAVIPLYKDPLGLANDGTPETIPFAQADELRRSLQYALSQGGSIIMHGYTHQYDAQKNPNDAVSADDYEFWNIVKNAPVKEDSLAWALGRINAGLLDLYRFGFKPWAWETPHYQGSPLSYEAAVKRFPISYQRVVYYSSLHPNLNAPGPDRDYAAGMFFPYEIWNDVYGEHIVPEDLGNIEYDISDEDPTSNITYTWQDILTNAEYARVVRDGYASFFFHPFWIEPEYSRLHAFSDFQNLVNGITRLGYHWTDGRSIFPRMRR